MINFKNLFPQKEEGQGLVEYALILVLVAIVVIAVLLVLGPAVRQVYCRVASALQPGSCGAITSTGSPQQNGASLKIRDIKVKETTIVTVTIDDRDNGTQTQSFTCNPGENCSINFGNTSTGSGKITTGEGDYIGFNY